MVAQIAVLILTHLALPLGFIVWLWKGTYSNKADWMVRLLLVGGFIAYISFAGRWDWVGYFWRFSFAGMYLYAIYRSFPRSEDVPLWTDRNAREWMSLATNVLIFLAFAAFTVYAVLGANYPGQAVALAFPLHDGAYYVGHGGSTAIVNNHTSHRAQRFALDIVALNPMGTRASGLYPADPSQYAIFGDTVYSPADGVVLETENDLHDLPPPRRDTASFSRDRDNLAGNRVILRRDSIRIVLAHLMQGSVLVEAGDSVLAGQPLGRVGNTGNTSEPHLHLHAMVGGDSTSALDGRGIPMLFDDRFLVRNSVVRRQPDTDS